MSKSDMLSNLSRVVSNMFAPFNAEEPLVSDEVIKILADIDARKDLHKIFDDPKSGKVEVKLKGDEISFFVET